MSTTAAERCPQCQQDGYLKSLSIGGCAYQFCSLCDYGNGVDDTVDDVMLAAIIASSVVDGGSPQCGAKVTIYACKTCGNDDVNLQKIVAFDEAADSMTVTVECMECHKMETMTYGCGDGANSNANPSRGTSLSTRPKLESDSDFYSADDDSNESDVSPNAEVYFVSNGEDGFPVSGIYDAHDDEDEGLPRNDSAYYRLETEQTVSQRSTDWLSCGKCNNGNWESFDLEFNPVTGQLERAHCLLCDCAADIPVDPQPATSGWFVECENCGNTDEQRFFKILDDSGDRLLSLHCLSCSAFHDFDRRPKSRFGRGLFRFGTRRGGAKRTPRKSDCAHRTRAAAVRSATRLAKDEGRRLDCSRERITDLGQLRRGDHICWYRWYAIFHHAIVVEVDCKKQQLTVIHNSGSLKPLNGKLASVRLEMINVNPTREDLFRCTYRTNSDDGDSAGLVCYPPDVVVDRAASRLNQTYNPLTFNCEHFAQWCRIGRQVSGQVCMCSHQSSFDLPVTPDM
jgi:hypothetical protein